jgi:hypothetical protein
MPNKLTHFLYFSMAVSNINFKVNQDRHHRAFKKNAENATDIQVQTLGKRYKIDPRFGSDTRNDNFRSKAL